MDEAWWAELERRVAALEAGTTPREGADRTSGTPDGGAPARTSPESAPSTFWVLEGLRPQARGSGSVVYAGTVRTGSGEVEWQFGHHVDDLVGPPDTLDGPAGSEAVDTTDRPDLSMAATRLAALGHPARLAILTAVLRGRDRTADLPELLDLGTSGQVYHHVKALTAAGWLRPAARGHVTVPPERVIPLLVAIGASR